MLSGLYHPDEGEIRVNGQPARITDEARAGTRYQHDFPRAFARAASFRGAERVPWTGGAGANRQGGEAPRRKAMLEETQKLYAKFFPTVEDVLVPVGQLGRKNRVIEIVKALSIKCSLVIMDEPTAVPLRSTNGGIVRFCAYAQIAGYRGNLHHAPPA